MEQKKTDRKNGKQTTHLKNTVFEQTKSQKVQNRDFYRSFGYFPRAAWVEKGHVSDSPPTVCGECGLRTTKKVYIKRFREQNI